MASPSPDDPFKHLPPPFGDMVRLMSQQAGDPAVQARGWAVQVATEGKPEGNVDPLTRMKVEQLARVAELRVTDATGLELTSQVLPCTRSQFAVTTVDHYAPLFASLTHAAQGEADADALDSVDDDDPMAWLAPLMKMMQPLMLSLSTGSFVGHLAIRGFGSYELPIPRPADAPVLLIIDNATAFARDWTLPEDDLILWLCLHQLTHHALLSVPHIRGRLERLLDTYTASFGQGDADMEDLFTGLDPTDPSALQAHFGNPEMLLGMIQTEAQRELLPQIHAVTAAIEGAVDVTMDRIGEQLIGAYPQVTEALRRRRVEADEAARFADHLLGFDQSQAHFDLGAAFANGVVEREGHDALAKLWQSEHGLPTPNEITAPGLWLARLEFED